MTGNRFSAIELTALVHIYYHRSDLQQSVGLLIKTTSFDIDDDGQVSTETLAHWCEVSHC